MGVFKRSLQRLFVQKKFGKPLDRLPKPWYNKYENRGRKTPQTRKGNDYEEDHHADHRELHRHQPHQRAGGSPQRAGCGAEPRS